MTLRIQPQRSRLAWSLVAQTSALTLYTERVLVSLTWRTKMQFKNCKAMYVKDLLESPEKYSGLLFRQVEITRSEKTPTLLHLKHGLIEFSNALGRNRFG